MARKSPIPSSSKFYTTISISNLFVPFSTTVDFNYNLQFPISSFMILHLSKEINNKIIISEIVHKNKHKNTRTNNKHKNNKLQRSFSITNKFNPEQRNTHKRKASFIVGGLSNNNNVTSKTQNTTRNTQNTNYLLKKKNTKKWFILCPKFLSYFIQTPKHLCEEGERRG
jgi:hypothetical protein